MRKFLKVVGIFLLILFCVSAVLAIPVWATVTQAETSAVTATSLLKYRGVDPTDGNPLLAAQVVSADKTSTKGLVILGTGWLSSSSEDNPLILASVQLTNGSVKLWTFPVSDVIDVIIRPGSAKLVFVIDHPNERLYDSKLGDPITKSYRSDGYYGKQSVEKLVDEFVSGIRLEMDQATFDRVFGGTN